MSRARRRRRWAPALVAASLALALAGCGVYTSPRALAPETYVEPPVIRPEAIAVFGQDQVDLAFDELTAFALEHAFHPTLLDPQKVDYTVEELALDVAWHLSDPAIVAWEAMVTSAVAGDLDATDAVRAIEFYRWGEPTWSLPPDGSPLVSQEITDATIGVTDPTVDGQIRLVTTFRQAGTMEYLSGGVPFMIEVTKSTTYWMVPATDDDDPRWRIDQWDGTFSVAEVKD